MSGYHLVEADGFEILVGKGARENDRLTFEVAAPDDFWLHAKDYAGSHVVVRNPQRLKKLSPGLLKRAAQLAVYHSKGREAGGKVEVHYCRVRNVSKPAGFPAGKVTLTKFESVKVYPRG